MDLGLKGKVAVVTGGSQGIGLATAKMFLEEGCKVAICARTEGILEEAAKDMAQYGDVYSEQVDVTSSKDMYRFADNVYKKFGSIDCWINNVGKTVVKKGDEYTEEEIDFVLNMCFKSAVYGCQAAFRYMKQQESGVIVNIASMAARIPTAGRSTLYGPQKAAIVNLSNCMAGEYAAWGVRVCAMLPGFTATKGVLGRLPQAHLDYNARETLLQRLGTPEEMAGPIVFLCSEQASYMTGTTLEASGGRCVTLNPTYSFNMKTLGCER